MCPACLAAAAWIVASAGVSGGPAAFVVKSRAEFDLTPLGRQEEGERGQAWIRHHDEYSAEEATVRLRSSSCFFGSR